MRYSVRFRSAAGLFSRETFLFTPSDVFYVFMRAEEEAEEGEPLAQAFIGRGEVQLHETALILEGRLPRFTVPLIWALYNRLLCEWTIRTIPYSRITGYRYSGNWIDKTPSKLVLKIIVLVLMGAFGGLLVARHAASQPWLIGLAAAWYLPLAIAVLCVGRRIHYVTYRLTHNVYYRVAFRLADRSRAAAAEFSRTLTEYRRVANNVEYQALEQRFSPT
jgi:hypothetical protein